MIRFFRKIRQNLLSEGNTGKYLKYAFGEILLVVIGILIALQVNIWNEERKKKLGVNQLLVDIERDLLTNYNGANFTLDFYRKQDSIARLIALNKLSEEDYTNNSNLRYFVANWEYLIPVEKNINQFVESEKLVRAEYKPIIESAKKIQYFKYVLEDTWSNLDQNIEDNSNVLSDFNWLVKNDSVSNSKAMGYFLNDEKYQTLALGYWVRVQNYYDKVSRYRAQTMATLATIKRIKYGFSNADIIELFQQNNMIPFEKYSCDIINSQLENLKRLRASELYANFTPNTLQLYLTNNNGESITEFKIAPNTFRTIPASGYFGLYGDNNTLVKVLDEKGNCISKYGAEENGYLSIE